LRKLHDAREPAVEPRESIKVHFPLDPASLAWLAFGPMEKLSRTASGTRHLRWAREVLATLRAHHDANTALSVDQKKTLADEVSRVEPRVHTLECAVVPYRDFIDRAHVDIRARQRVADYLCDDAQRQADGALKPHRAEIASVLPGGYSAILSNQRLSVVLKAGRQKTVKLARTAASILRTLPPKIPGTAPLADALDQAAGLLDQFNQTAETIEAQRLPLKSAVQKAIIELREELDQMDGRLRSHFSQLFIDSLYPELAKGGAVVADEDDEDDDTSAPPETTPPT